MLSFEQLSTPITSAQAEEEIIQRLSELGFASRGWQSESMQLTLGVKLPAWLYSRFTVYVSSVVVGMFNDSATGDLLTRFSASHYDNTRVPAVAAQYTVRHTVASGQGPHTGIQVGDLIASNGTKTYRNITTDDLTSAATVDLVYEAEEPGQDSNTADGTLNFLVTSLAGVTITNPANSIVQAGANEESDESLKIRNPARWSGLSIESPADHYRGLALTVAGIGRCEVDDTNPRGPYTLDVYVAGPNAAAGETARAEVEALLDTQRSPTADVEVIEPTTQTITVAGTVYVNRAYSSSAPAAVVAAIEAHVNTIAIGGAQLTESQKGVAEDGVKEAIRGVAGVQNVNLTSPVADVTITGFRLAVANTAGLSFTFLT
jgi:uncharacterized phage protein gp47/JayE